MNKAVALMLLVFLSEVNTIVAQITFQKSFYVPFYGVGNTVKQTTDDGYIIGGALAVGFESFNMCLIKTNNFGDTLWTKIFCYEEEAMGQSVSQTNDGGFIIAGSIMNSPNPGFYLVKTNPNGDTTWTRMYSNYFSPDYCVIRETNDNGFILVGGNWFVHPDFKAKIIKLNSFGDTLWTKNYGDSISGHTINTFRQTLDGGYIFAGSVQDPVTGFPDLLMFKTDSDGNFAWSKSYGSPEGEWGTDIQQTHDGGYVITGHGFGFSSPGSGYLVRTDETGNLLWSKYYTWANSNFAYPQFNSVHEIEDGSLIIGMNDHPSASFLDMTFMKTDANGNIIWSKIYGGTEDEGILSFEPTSDNGFILAGWKRDQGIYLVKTDSDGNSGCYQNGIALNAYEAPTIIGFPLTTLCADTNASLIPQNTIVNSGCSVTTYCFSNYIPQVLSGIFPNPVYDNFTLYSPGDPIVSIDIFNMLGEYMFRRESINSEICTFDCTLAAGAYLAKVKTNSIAFSSKFTVVKR